MLIEKLKSGGSPSSQLPKGYFIFFFLELFGAQTLKSLFDGTSSFSWSSHCPWNEEIV
jgi:hypothetical protein